jgi:hypothetical protein
MTPGLEWLLIAWGNVTGVLIILLIYRSTLTMKEDDQLFLDESSSAMATEQRELIAKVNKINPLVKVAFLARSIALGWELDSYCADESINPEM